MRFEFFTATCVLLAFGSGLPAAPVTVVNPGFEALYFGGNLPAPFGGDVPPTAFPTGAPPDGWTTFGATGGQAFVGVLNPGVQTPETLNHTSFPAGAPEGDNVAMLFFSDHHGGAEFGIEQQLQAVLQADTIHTLSVGVGNIASGTSNVPPYSMFGDNNDGFFDLRGFPGYRIDLLAGSMVIAGDDNTLSPGEGIFETSTNQAAIGAAHPQLAEPLTIRLVNLNMQDVNDPAVDLEVDFDAVFLDASPIPVPGSLAWPGVAGGTGTAVADRAARTAGFAGHF